MLTRGAVALAALGVAGFLPANAAGSDSGWSTQARIVAPKAADGSDFGSSVVVSADGSTMVVGAQYQDSAAGAAYVYQLRNDAWTSVATLKASDAKQDDQFGWRLAVSADGATIVVGAPGRSHHTGVAYVFTQIGTKWSQAAELSTSASVPNSSFGQGVAVSASGSLVAVSAHSQPNIGGAVFVYEGSAGEWKRMARLTDPHKYEGGFGGAIAMSGDASTIIVAALMGGAQESGTAYAFTGGGRTWTASGAIQAEDADAYDYFGASLGVSADGSSIAVGAPQHNENNNGGGVYVFDHDVNGWTQAAEFAPTRSIAEWNFGWSLAMSSDGSRVVGAAANIRDPARARAWAYTRFAGGFHEGRIIAPRGSGSDSFGMSLAMSGDGLHVFLGADIAVKGRGAVYALQP